MSWTKLEDSSEYIYYDDQWIFANANGGTTNDGAEMRYSETTWHLTQTDGAKAIIKWTGEDVEFFGALRGNHGYYAVSIDGGPKSYRSGQGQEEFQVSLFASVNLTLGDHVAEFTNEPLYMQTSVGDTYVDIDFISVKGTPILPDTPSQAKLDPPRADLSAPQSTVPVPLPTSSSSTISSTLSSAISISTAITTTTSLSGGADSGEDEVIGYITTIPTSSSIRVLPLVSETRSGRETEIIIATSTPKLRQPSMLAVMADANVLQNKSGRQVGLDVEMGGLIAILWVWVFVRNWTSI